MYSRSSGSRAASSGRPMAENTLNCPPPEPLQLQHRYANAALSTNDPRPANNFVAANGQPVDARTHIINNQSWRARQPDDLRHTLTNRRDGEPMQSLSRLGPKCFGPMIRGEKYPMNFKAPKEIEKYDPSYNPSVWLDTYLMAMGIAGHTDLLAARYLPLMMEGACRQWINTLPPDSIDSWEEMRDAFVRHFEGSYTRATTIEDLERCVQGPRESTRSWVQQWQDLWYNVIGIHPHTAIHCFKTSCRYEPLVAKLKRAYRTLDNIPDLLEIAKWYAEEDPNQETDDESGGHRRTSGHDNGRRPELRYSSTRLTGKRRSDVRVNFVANSGYAQREPKSFRRDGGQRRDGGNYKAKPRFDPAALLNQPCVFHSREGKPATHTTVDCHSLKETEKARRAQGDRDDNPPNGGKFGSVAGSLHTFTGFNMKREKKVLARAVAVNAVAQVDVPQFLNWSEQPITWSRQDHSPRIEYPGRVALVVKPKVGDYWLPKTLMDGGSSINILYLDTFRRLRPPQSMIETTHTTFHGIVPGRKAYPIGKVTLPVTFGTPANFRTERIVFELVPFDSPYHCVLGRQAFAKFMAAPHYAYNAMKLPGPCGVITINGDPDMAAECEAKGAELADAVIAAEANHADELAKYASRSTTT